MYSLGEYYIVIPKILKVWPSYIAGKRSFIAFPIYEMSGSTLFLVDQVYLIFYQYISQIYLKCTCCVRWGGVTPPPPHPPGRYIPERECHKYSLTKLVYGPVNIATSLIQQFSHVRCHSDLSIPVFCVSPYS